MGCTILDCYTDEPSGLGVPPYLGVYPRYIYGKLKGKIDYITIDDLRFNKKDSINKNLNILNKNKNKLIKKISNNKNLIKKFQKNEIKTNIKIYNLTKSSEKIKEILEETETLIVILGVHTPGKYLSAVPGTLKEVIGLIRDMNCKKILTGPAVFGTATEGGKFFERADLSVFDEIKDYNFSFSGLRAKEGASLIEQIPDERIIEIETGRGCPRINGCSFCLEPIKHKGIVFRKVDFIVDEVKAFYELGCRYFRLGKQSCFYSYPDIKELLKGIWDKCPEIKVLHIDNVNPAMVDEEKTKLITRYCTSGNVAAFGVESFDSRVVSENNLNSDPETTMKAIKIINKYGKEIGANGMPKFLPGINLLFGLKGESKKTHEENMKYLKQIIDENLLLRRINIRQVNIFEGTELYKTTGNKFIRKNKKYYWKWRNEVRQKVDFPMLQRLVPIDSALKNVRMEIYDGNTTFGRQFGTYPLIVGVKERLSLKKFYDVKVVGHMLRSVIAKVI